MNSVFEVFVSAAERFPQRAAVEVFRRTGLDTYAYREVRQLAERTACLLGAAGYEAGTRCAILADNDARWCSTYLGVLRLGAVAVPLDTSYKASQVKTVLQDSGARVLFTTARYLPTAEEASAGMTPAPQIVMMAGTIAGLVSLDQPGNDRAAPPACPATRSDPAVILYTSGTTSDPKGVVLTHGNLLAERDAALQVVTIDEHDRILGILPLFHALAQIANLLLPFTTGARVVFLDTLNSNEMMRALQDRHITAFCVVPQFYYLLHQRVVERVAASSWSARVIFRTLLVLNGWLRQRLGVNAGRFLFRAVHAALGGRMRIMVTGGSRFDPRIGRDLYRMGLNIVQAYGLTECSGAATMTRPGDARIESVGQALSGVEVRVLDDPADTQTRDHRDGEVLIKGPIVMAGYHNRPDATAATLQDGWLYTGDLGYFDAGRRLHITGRKKDVIVLASGKNIYPEDVEAVYAQSPYIAEICVIGVARPDDPSSERLHAIVVPHLELMRERRIVNTREIIRFDIEGLSLQLPHHKRVLSFDIWRDPLPRTTTRKLRRHEIERLYYDRAADTAGPTEQPEWRDEDQGWAAEPHVQRVIEAI
ncbi:MAG: AMP-binding protein, partial [Acidobacteriota bacterium]